MPITFYAGSGSPFAWLVWLALEHKRLPYQLKLLSLQNGDLKTPEYLVIHPRGKVPALIADGFAFRESIAIVEYLEDRYPDMPLFPFQPAQKAIARRLVQEAHGYLYPPLRRLMETTLMRREILPTPADQAVIDSAIPDLRKELDYFESEIAGEFLCGLLSVADFALYPLLALLKRICAKFPEHNDSLSMGPKMTAFMQHIEQLPYFDNTYPPHWKE
jgi:glutathione S-transferase